MTGLSLCGALDDQRRSIYAHLISLFKSHKCLFKNLLSQSPERYSASLCSCCGPRGGSTSAGAQDQAGTSRFDEPAQEKEGGKNGKLFTGKV